jgi:hypothetical protein
VPSESVVSPFFYCCCKADLQKIIIIKNMIGDASLQTNQVSSIKKMYYPVPDTSLHTPLIDNVPSLNELTFEQVVESYSNNLLDGDDMDQIHVRNHSY